MRDNNTDYEGVSAVVLGASGFIGRWVARFLSETGADLHLFVRDVVKAETIFSIYQVHGRVHKLDLLDFEAVRAQLHEVKPSIIFNLAGYGIDKSEREPEIYNQINAKLVGLLCDVMVDIKDKSWIGQDIVHVGSALEYGYAGGNLSEDTIPEPTTIYGKSKLEGTRLLTHSCEMYKLKGLTARLFTVYGPGEHPGRLLPSLLKIARSRRDALPLTAGYQKRDFTYIADIAKGLLFLGLAKTSQSEIINMATGILTTVRDFVNIGAGLMDIQPRQLKFGILPIRIEEMEHKPVSIKRLLGLTGWFPPTRIAEGIQNTINFESDKNTLT